MTPNLFEYDVLKMTDGSFQTQNSHNEKIKFHHQCLSLQNNKRKRLTPLIIAHVEGQVCYSCTC